MAVRTPLYWDGTGIAPMSASQVTDCVDEMIRQHGLSPAVSLSYVASSGSLDSMDDTRLISGASSVSASAFPNEATTAEPTTLTVTYDNISSASSASTPTDTANKAFPVFYDSGSGSIQAMSLSDMIDTFVDPALLRLVTNGWTGLVADHDGLYFISTDNSIQTNHALVNASPVFTNTIADTASFLAANIGTAGTTQDFPTTVTNYYLRKFQRAGGSSTYLGPSSTPLQIKDGDNDNLQAYTEANLGTILQDVIQHATANVSGKRIQYSIVTSLTGTQMNTAMVDTQLTGGSGNYQTLQVSGSDYRAQEFPDGTPTTQTTYYLQAALF